MMSYLQQIEEGAEAVVRLGGGGGGVGCVPFAISVDGASLKMEGRLEDLKAMVLQDEATCCIILGPVRHLQQAASLLRTQKQHPLCSAS